MITNPYITREQVDFILADLNVCWDQGMKEARVKDLLERAIGDLESDLARKYVVPLSSKVSPFLNSPQSGSYKFAAAKVQNAMKAKLRAIIGFDQNRNITGVIENTQKFLNTAETEYNAHIKDLLDPKIDFGFLLLSQAEDAQSPVQHLSLSRANNRTSSNSGRGGWGDDWQ